MNTCTRCLLKKKNSQQCTTCTKIYAVFHPLSVDISINRKNIIAHFLHMYHKRFVSIWEDIKVKGTNYQYRRNSRLSSYCRNTVLFLNLHTSVTWSGYSESLRYFRCKRSANKSYIQWREITFRKYNLSLRYSFWVESDNYKFNVIWLRH